MKTLNLFPATDRGSLGARADMMSKYEWTGFHPYADIEAGVYSDSGVTLDLDLDKMTREEYENFIDERVMEEGRDPYIYAPIRRFQIAGKKQKSMRALVSKISFYYDRYDVCCHFRQAG